MDNTSSNSFLSNKPDKYNKKDYFFFQKNLYVAYLFQNVLRINSYITNLIL